MSFNATSLSLFAIVVAVIAGFIAYGRWWNLHGDGSKRREQEQRRKAERAASARVRGWTYDGTIDGNIFYRISGDTPHGPAWSIHYDSDQSSSSSSPKLIFQAASPTSSVYRWTIHDRMTYDITQKAGVRVIVGGLSKLIGTFSDAMKLKRDFYLNAKVLPAGSRSFAQRYVLAATDARWASLIDHDVERQIIHWPAFKQSMSLRDNCFSAELGPQGLRVQLYCDAPDFAVIEHMARLGRRLAEKAATIDAT